jgi:hypothetical protein
MTAPEFIRVSNMSTFRKCKRKAFLQVLQAEASPTSNGDSGNSTESQTFGTVTHKVIELWLKFARLPPRTRNEAHDFIIAVRSDDEFMDKVGHALTVDIVLEAAKVAAKGLHLLPAPGKGLVVEEPFKAEAAGIKSQGIDLYDTRPTASLKQHADGTPIRLFDQKTCKTPAYVPTPEAMKDDVQAISYAHELMRRYCVDREGLMPGNWGFVSGWGSEIGCRWVYYPRNNAPAVAVDFKFTWAELQEKWAAIVADRRELGELLAQGPDAWEAVPGNSEHCGDYGGCQFRSRCGALADVGPSLFATVTTVTTVNNPAQPGKEGSDMGLMDRARAGEKVGAAVSAPMPQAAVTVAQATQTPAPAASQSLFAKKVAAAQPQQPQPTATQPQPQDLSTMLKASLRAAGVGMAITDAEWGGEGDGDTDGDEEAGEVADLGAAAAQDVVEGLTVTTPTGRVIQVNPEADARARALLASSAGSVGAATAGINPPDAAPADPNPPDPTTKPKGKGGRKAKAPAAATPLEAIAGPLGDAVIVSTVTKEEAVEALAAMTAAKEQPLTLEYRETAFDVVAKLRTRAEARFEQGNHAAAAELFVVAQLIERGAL